MCKEGKLRFERPVPKGSVPALTIGSKILRDLAHPLPVAYNQHSPISRVPEISHSNPSPSSSVFCPLCFPVFIYFLK